MRVCDDDDDVCDDDDDVCDDDDERLCRWMMMMFVMHDDDVCDV